MPNINEMFLKSEVFKYAMSLDWKMEYYHIWITEDTSNLCIIINPWGVYHYKRPEMGVSNSLDIFQQKMKYYFKYFNLLVCT